MSLPFNPCLILLGWKLLLHVVVACQFLNCQHWAQNGLGDGQRLVETDFNTLLMHLFSHCINILHDDMRFSKSINPSSLIRVCEESLSYCLLGKTVSKIISTLSGFSLSYSCYIAHNLCFHCKLVKYTLLLFFLNDDNGQKLNAFI